ncbi:hypothetical protein I2W78_24660 [Streptomyces spinoverrucosus]|uniref:hypothetical protein n=1 Tax=Streptomyces spinoverrucosus TaxID=284043 RepID=UPI0018C404CE|nr:hypothetical protein [Streptomyces spinoverrucosus]MBG0854949.1 hypothetical protein [Streptomyces spinoverrucosus]
MTATASPTTRKRRVLMLAASTALAAGGALVPTGAFAAPATPPATTITADWDNRDSEDRDNSDEDRDSTDEDTKTAPESTEGSETAPESGGVVSESYCSSPTRAPGLCVDGKPIPKGDGTVKVPQGTVVPSPTGSSTAELAV